MTLIDFLPKCGADKSISAERRVFTHQVDMHNDFMYVIFSRMRNTNSCSKSSTVAVGTQTHCGYWPEKRGCPMMYLVQSSAHLSMVWSAELRLIHVI